MKWDPACWDISRGIDSIGGLDRLEDWYVSGSTFKRLRRSKIQAALCAVQLLRCTQHSTAFGVQGFEVSTFERCAAAFESREAALEHRT